MCRARLQETAILTKRVFFKPVLSARRETLVCWLLIEPAVNLLNNQTCPGSWWCSFKRASELWWSIAVFRLAYCRHMCCNLSGWHLVLQLAFWNTLGIVCKLVTAFPSNCSSYLIASLSLGVVLVCVINGWLSIQQDVTGYAKPLCTANFAVPTLLKLMVKLDWTVLSRLVARTYMLLVPASQWQCWWKASACFFLNQAWQLICRFSLPGTMLQWKCYLASLFDVVKLWWSNQNNFC